jgi:hypothetical protein
MLSKKTTKTLAKWPNGVFEEFIASGMKLEDLLDEDIKPNIIRGIRSAGSATSITSPPATPRKIGQMPPSST